MPLQKALGHTNAVLCRSIQGVQRLLGSFPQMGDLCTLPHTRSSLDQTFLQSTASMPRIQRSRGACNPQSVTCSMSTCASSLLYLQALLLDGSIIPRENMGKEGKKCVQRGERKPLTRYPPMMGRQIPLPHDLLARYNHQ